MFELNTSFKKKFLLPKLSAEETRESQKHENQDQANPNTDKDHDQVRVPLSQRRNPSHLHGEVGERLLCLRRVDR